MLTWLLPLSRRLRHKRSSPVAAQLAALSLLLLDVIVFAISIVLASDTSAYSSSRSARLPQLAAVFGAHNPRGQGNVVSSVWLWIARGCLVLFVVLIWWLRRAMRANGRAS